MVCDLVADAVERIGDRAVDVGEHGGERSGDDDVRGRKGRLLEEDKLRRRRESNRLSAKRANARRKAWVIDLARDVALGKARATQLHARESRLRSENDVLRWRLEYRTKRGAGV
jgi:hypothetical protein